MVLAAGLDLIVTYAPGQRQSLSLRGIGCLTMELMQKYSKENVGIDDTTRWPIDSNAVGFLSSTTSARSISDLSQVCRHLCFGCLSAIGFCYSQPPASTPKVSAPFHG